MTPNEIDMAQRAAAAMIVWATVEAPDESDRSAMIADALAAVRSGGQSGAFIEAYTDFVAAHAHDGFSSRVLLRVVD